MLVNGGAHERRAEQTTPNEQRLAKAVQERWERSER